MCLKSIFEQPTLYPVSSIKPYNLRIASSISSLFFFLLILSCKRSEPSSVKEPYPPLDEQRTLLSKKPYVVPTRLLDSIQLIKDLEYLASATCEGRKPGSLGHEKAMNWIIQGMREAGLDSFNNKLIKTFSGIEVNGTTNGVNVVGWIKGSAHPEKYIVLSAHYDHLGQFSNGIYFGADDNASGVACLLALASYFKQHPLAYSLVFVALDREETGLEGAYHFVNDLDNILSIQNIKFNLNMDMVARSDNNEIFACGIKHYPNFAYVVNEVQYKTNVKLLMGHDFGSPEYDWTFLSDQGAFHEKGIPFIYVGVEDHPDYHRPSDTVDKINYSSYLENCNMIALMTQALKL